MKYLWQLWWGVRLTFNCKILKLCLFLNLVCLNIVYFPKLRGDSVFLHLLPEIKNNPLFTVNETIFWLKNHKKYCYLIVNYLVFKENFPDYCLIKKIFLYSMMNSELKNGAFIKVISFQPIPCFIWSLHSLKVFIKG